MFISDKFYLNNKHSSAIGVALVNFEESVLSDYGVSYGIEISKESTSNSFNHYSVVGEVVDDLVLNMCLVDGKYIPQTWTRENLEQVYSHIITDDFVPFISEDDLETIYYIKAKNIVKKFNHKRQGYLEVTFQLYSNNAYKKEVKEANVETEKILKIRNVSNTSAEFYCPIVEIENKGDENTVIVIENTSIPSIPFEIQGLANGEKVIVDNLICSVVNTDGISRFSLCNRGWLKLKKFDNSIRVIGNCHIKIKSEFPVVR